MDECYTTVPTLKRMEQIKWAWFRRNSAKDILCAMLSTKQSADIDDITTAINIADELIKQLQINPKNED